MRVQVNFYEGKRAKHRLPVSATEIDGGWELSALGTNHTFFGYSKRAAVAMFRAELAAVAR